MQDQQRERILNRKVFAVNIVITKRTIDKNYSFRVYRGNEWIVTRVASSVDEGLAVLIVQHSSDITQTQFINTMYRLVGTKAEDEALEMYPFNEMPTKKPEDF